MHDDIDLTRDPDVVRDVVTDEFESIAPEQSLDVLDLAGLEIVDADDLIAPVEKPLAEMGPQKSGSAGDNDSCHGSATDAAVHEAESSE
jgi:hypothetical protein